MITFQDNDPGAGPSRAPWFAKQWGIPLNRCIYTAFSYMTFLLYIILYVSEVQPPVIHWIDILTAIWIISYTFRDIGTGIILKKEIMEYLTPDNYTTARNQI